MNNPSFAAPGYPSLAPDAHVQDSTHGKGSKLDIWTVHAYRCMSQCLDACVGCDVVTWMFLPGVHEAGCRLVKQLLARCRLYAEMFKEPRQLSQRPSVLISSLICI